MQIIASIHRSDFYSSTPPYCNEALDSQVESKGNWESEAADGCRCLKKKLMITIIKPINHSIFFLLRSTTPDLINIPLIDDDFATTGFPNFSANVSLPFSRASFMLSFWSVLSTKSSSSSLSLSFGFAFDWFTDLFLPTSFSVSLVIRLVMFRAGLFVWVFLIRLEIKELNSYCLVSLIFC